MPGVRQTGNEFRGKRLAPGIYIGSRKVPAPGNFRHQFMVLVPRDVERFKGKLQDLGNGVKGMVVGGYADAGIIKNIFGRAVMKYHRNHPKDLERVRRYVNDDPGEDATVFRTEVQEDILDDKIDEVMARGRAYRGNTKNDPVRYPGIIKNLLGWGKNSNTFTQSLASRSGINGRRMDHPGVDPGKRMRLPAELFNIKEGSIMNVGYMDGYLVKYAKKKGPQTVVGTIGNKFVGPRVEDVKKRADKALTDDPSMPLEVLGEPEVISKMSPTARAALVAVLAAIPGSIAGGAIGDLAMPDSKNAPVVGAGIGAASLSIPAAILTYMSQRAQGRQDERSKEKWYEEIDKEYQSQ